MMNHLIESRSFSIKRWFILILSVRLVPIIQANYLPINQPNQFDQFNHFNYFNQTDLNSDLSTLESIHDASYVQNRDYILNHFNQLNNQFAYDNISSFHYDGNTGQQQSKYEQNYKTTSDEDRSNVLTKRIALSSLANIFGGGSSEEEKKIDDKIIVDNQTETKSLIDKKENSSIILDDTNRDLKNNGNLSNLSSVINSDDQSPFLKNHVQNDKEIDTLNRLINFSKNYENWPDHFKNSFNLNNHRQDLINLFNLNGTSFSDLSPSLSTSSFSLPSLVNTTNKQDQSNLSKAKNLFVYFSPEYASSKPTMFENNHFGFKPNSMLSSLINSNNDQYLSRFNSPSETISDASDQTTEYDEDVIVNEDENPSKLIDNRNEQSKHERKRKKLRNRNRSSINNSRLRQKGNAKIRKVFDNQPFNSRSIMQSGFKPLENKMLKEQSQISASTGIKRNSVNKNFRNKNQNQNLNDLSLVETSQQNQNESINSINNQNNNPVTIISTTTTGHSTSNGNKSKRFNQTSITTTPTSFDQDFDTLSISNKPYQPYLMKPQTYRLPTSLYGKRLISDILNNQSNIRKNLVSSSNSNNKLNNNESVDQLLDDENNDTTDKEDILNEQDKQLVTDKTKDTSLSSSSFFEKNSDDDLQSEIPSNEFDKEYDKTSDLINNQHQTNNQLINQQSGNQQIDLGQLNQQTGEIESNENDAIENDNELLNIFSTAATNNNTNKDKESDNLDIITTTATLSTIESTMNSNGNEKSKSMINELNKSSKQDKNSFKFKPNKKANWKQLTDQNFKNYKIYDKYNNKINTGLTGTSSSGSSGFNFDQNYPMSTYLSNENFKINLSGSKSSELDDDLSTGSLFPYPNVQYNKPSSFNSLYYPFMKKKPFFSSYPSSYTAGFTNPLNGMLFDKINMPIDSYSIEKIPSSLSSPLTSSLPIKTSIDLNSKGVLDNKFYNLDNKLHHLNSKYSLNSLNPPPYIPPHHLDATKYYDPKAHYDSKYHNSMNHWQSGLAGFLLGVVPFSFLLASMAPTISAISSGTAAAAALGRRRRSTNNIDDHYTTLDNKTTNDHSNIICLSKLSTIISSLNELVKEKDEIKQEKSKIYFDQLINLQNKCEFNISLPIDFYQEMNNILNSNSNQFRSKNEKSIKSKLRESYYSYNLGNSKSIMDTIINFLSNFDFIKTLGDLNQIQNQFRTSTNSINHTNNYANPNKLFSTYQSVNLSEKNFHFKEIKCLQEMICKVILSPTLEKSLFSNVISLVANITPTNVVNKYGLDVLVHGLQNHNCVLSSGTYC